MSIKKKILSTVVAVTFVLGLVVSPVAAATQAELEAMITALTEQLAQAQRLLAQTTTATTTGTVQGCAITSFTANLRVGSKGDAVKCLQIVLNSDPTTQVATTGVGSTGNETSYFGPATKAAVIKFQNKYASEILSVFGLTSGTGFVGSATRAKLNTMLATGTGTGTGTGALPAGCSSTAGYSSTTGVKCDIGVAVVVLPAGCTSTAGYSTTTGVKCDSTGAVSTANTVSLAASSPAATIVAKGSQDQVFTVLNLAAGNDAYAITSISITRTGVSADGDLTNVKLYDGTTQIGSTQALSTTTHKAVFSNLSLMIQANSVKQITVKASLSSSASVANSITLGVASASDIVAGGITLGGNFPVNGSYKSVATQAVGTLTADILATPSASNPIAGSVEQHVATLQLTSAIEGFDVRSLKLTQVGTAGNSDISNVKVKYGATVLGTAASLTNSSVTISGSPLINIPVGTSKNLDVYVDVAGGINTSRTIIWEVTQASDVDAVGTSSGGLVTTTAATAAGFPEQGATHTISQGTLVTALDAATNPSAQSYVLGTTNRTITAVKLSTGSTEGVRVTQITLTLAGTDAASTDISNIALYDGATLISGPNGISGTTVQFGTNTVNTYDVSGLIDIPASTNKVLTVKADIPS
ncbi:MAG: hypothetical protein COS96_00510, partial [Candidatus Nealsonbacteria bacterium CG07_land_8_20_14_0_80_39_13]